MLNQNKYKKMLDILFLSFLKSVINEKMKWELCHAEKQSLLC